MSRASRAMARRDAIELPTLGIGLGVLAYALFSLHDATIKWLVAALPVWQVLFFRSATIVIGSLAIGRTALMARAIVTPLKWNLLLRGGITLAAWLCYYTASRALPLAQMLSLYFAAPLMVTVLAGPLLGERVTGGRWAAVLVGFAGIVLATDPLDVSLSLPSLLVLIAAALWGYGIILMRRIARRESSMLQMLYVNGFFLVGTAIACPFVWITPSWSELALLLAIGLLGGIAQFTLFEGCRHAPASVMATVEYTALVWAFVLGFVIWGDIPVPAVFIGAGLILLAGMLLVLLERRGARLAAVQG
jgi:drug/metabolite transporter (DMT)-like permease